MYDVFIEWEGRKPLSRFRKRARLRRENRRRLGLRDLDADPGCLDFDAIAVILLALLAIVVIVVFAPLAIALAIEVIALVVLLLVALCGAVFRTLFRRPWRVVAMAEDGELWAWRQVGWRNSNELVESIRQGIDAGLAPGTLHTDALEAGSPRQLSDTSDLGPLANPWFRFGAVAWLLVVVGVAVLVRLT